MFKITESKGMQIVFPNGYEASIQFGKGNYCSNRYKEDTTNVKELVNTSCPNTEVGCFNPEGDPIILEGRTDYWLGHVTPLELIAILDQISKL